MNEGHIVIRDNLGNKHFEVIREDGFISIYDYALKRFLRGEEKVEWLEGRHPSISAYIPLSGTLHLNN